MTWPRPPAPPRWVACLALLLASGIVQGRLTHRWAAPPGLAAAVARVDLLPRLVGDWAGEDVDVDRATLRRIGIAGGVQRRYRNSRTGEGATVLLVCGRPGPVSVHTPDVCYEGAGYELTAPPAGAIPGFLAAKMARRDAAAPDRLQVYWSWNASGRWEVPDNPRLAFGARPYLFKLYVVRDATASEDDLSAGPAADLARALASAFDPTDDRRHLPAPGI